MKEPKIKIRLKLGKKLSDSAFFSDLSLKTNKALEKKLIKKGALRKYKKWQ